MMLSRGGLMRRDRVNALRNEVERSGTKARRKGSYRLTSASSGPVYAAQRPQIHRQNYREIWSVPFLTEGRQLTRLFEQKKKQTKKVPPLGSVRDFPCRACVTRATKAPGHECASQDNTGAACWDCAKNAHTCKPLKRANADPDDAWRTAAQRASQQLRACGSGAALPATPGPAPALASFGEIAEKSPEERKIMALETIAEAARLWILNKPDEEEEEEEEDS
ncbi:hypothetical protein MRS44_013641 [Fusarium solani]|uniref:uncharacterized protein n=1 Tax=Fusarium solani TaxID=169388 RepID=UPI0032C4607D|nr:hypothetical protein MRS44_013641 [Fusarium solani]